MSDQYIAFWQRLFQGDFGVSFFQFPTPVIELIRTALPWTLGLLLVTTAIAWTLGIFLGGLAATSIARAGRELLDSGAMIIRPMPYYIFAFALSFCLATFSPCFRFPAAPTSAASPHSLGLHLQMFSGTLSAGLVASSS